MKTRNAQSFWLPIAHSDVPGPHTVLVCTLTPVPYWTMTTRKRWKLLAQFLSSVWYFPLEFCPMLFRITLQELALRMAIYSVWQQSVIYFLSRGEGERWSWKSIIPVLKWGGSFRAQSLSTLLHRLRYYTIHYYIVSGIQSVTAAIQNAYVK